MCWYLLAEEARSGLLPLSASCHEDQVVFDDVLDLYTGLLVAQWLQHPQYQHQIELTSDGEVAILEYFWSVPDVLLADQVQNMLVLNVSFRVSLD